MHKTYEELPKTLFQALVLADALCIEGSCHCLDLNLAYHSSGGVESMYQNSSTEAGCFYTAPTQSFLQESAQSLPPVLKRAGLPIDFAPSPSPFLPPPLFARQAVGQIGTNLSRRLQMPETLYALPHSSLGSSQRQALSALRSLLTVQAFHVLTSACQDLFFATSISMETE